MIKSTYYELTLDDSCSLKQMLGILNITMKAYCWDVYALQPHSKHQRDNITNTGEQGHYKRAQCDPLSLSLWYHSSQKQRQS